MFNGYHCGNHDGHTNRLPINSNLHGDMPVGSGPTINNHINGYVENVDNTGINPGALAGRAKGGAKSISEQVYNLNPLIERGASWIGNNITDNLSSTKVRSGIGDSVSVPVLQEVGKWKFRRYMKKIHPGDTANGNRILSNKIKVDL